MRKEISRLITTIGLYYTQLDLVNAVASYCVAQAVSAQMRVPAQQVADASEYYDENFHSAAMAFGEEAAMWSGVSVARISQLCRTLWLARYAYVHSALSFDPLVGVSAGSLSYEPLEKVSKTENFDRMILGTTTDRNNLAQAIIAHYAGMAEAANSAKMA